MTMRQHQFGHESDKTFWAQNRGTTHRDLSSRASSATLRLLQQQQPYNHLEGRRERTDVSIAQGLLREEALNHPMRQSSFNISPLPDSRSFLTGGDGQSDFPPNTTEHDRRKNGNTSNTWTDSSLETELEDEEDRTDFVKEYNRLAEKHGVRKIIPEGYEGVDIDTVTITGKHGSWLMRKILRRTSSTHTLNIKSDRQIRHKRSVSDFSTRLRLKRHTLRDKTLRELVDLCGRSLLYLPSDYAASSLTLPTCLRATAHYIVQYGITTRGIFRIPGSSSSTLTLYNYYATVDERADAICGTVRSPTLPEHLHYDAHDVASVFKKFLSGLPGGILQGSINLFEALIGIQSYLNPDPEWTRTKQSKVRARLIALAIGSVKSRLQRELMCAVFGLLCMIGRAAELAPREDDRGRPLPTSGLMGYGALGIIFGPLLLGETLDTYDMRFAHGGVIVFPVAPSTIRKDSNKIVSYKRKGVDDLSYAATKFDKVKVANGITEMVITHWRDVVRHMRGLGVLKTNKDLASGVPSGRKGSQLRPYASEVFTLKKPPEWGTEDQSIRQVNQTPSPTPLQRHISQSEPGPVNQHNDYLKIRKQRTRPSPPTVPILSGSKSMGTLSPMAEEPTSEDRNEKMPFQNSFPHPLQVPGVPLRKPLPSNPILLEAANQLKSPRERSDQRSTETSGLLAEVARSLQEDAQKLMGINKSNHPRTKTPMAELPSLTKDEETQELNQTKTTDGNSDVTDGSPDKETADTNPPGLESPTKDNAANVDLQSNPLIEIVRQEPAQASSPRSKARILFEEATRNLVSSTPRPDQVKGGSSGARLISPHRLPWNKGKESVTVSPGEVESSLVQPSIGAQKSLRNVAREFFERADREKASTAVSTGDQVNTASPSPPKPDSQVNHSSSAGEPESKAHAPALSRASKSESPLKSEVQRPSTPYTKDAFQRSPNEVSFAKVTEPITPPRNSVSKPNDKFSLRQSPHRLTFLRFETSNQPKESETAEEVQHSPKESGIPQGLVFKRIRGLAASDPGNQSFEHTELKAAPDIVRPLANTTAKRKSKSESTISPVKNTLDRTSYETDLKSLSDLASAVKSRVQDASSVGTIQPDQRNSGTPPSPVSQTPIRSKKGSLKWAEEDSPTDGKELLIRDQKNQDEVDYFSRNLFRSRSKADSKDQKSDASDATVILAPRKQFLAIDESPKDPQRFFRRGNNGTVTSPKANGSVSNGPTSSNPEILEKPSDATNDGGTTSPSRVARQPPVFRIPQLNSANNTPNSKTKDPQSQSPTQTLENQSPTKGLKSGSVMALAAKFNHVEQSPPTASPVKRPRPQSIVRNGTFRRANNLVSNYTTNVPSPSSPSPVKSTHSERSDVRSIRNPFPADRRPEAQLHKTPQKEISPMHRTPRTGGPKENGSPSPFSVSKPGSSPVQSKMRSAVDGNNSQSSPKPMTPCPYHKPTILRLVNNSSPVQRATNNQSPSLRESLGARPPSSTGTVLPHPVEPPVDGHVSFNRPISTPRRMPHEDEVIRVMTPSGNAALYDQIRKLQKQLDAAKDELTHYKKQLDERGDLKDLGTLSEMLRESRRECKGWKARAEAAERRLGLLEGFKGKAAADKVDDGDGASDVEDLTHDVDMDSEASTETAIVRLGRHGTVKGKSKTSIVPTDRATRSTDTEIWIKGGTATFLRTSPIAKECGSRTSAMERGSPTRGSGGGEEEKIVVGGLVLGIKKVKDGSDESGEIITIRRNRGVGVDGATGSLDESGAGKRGRERGRERGKSMGKSESRGEVGSEWSLLDEFK